MQLRNPDGFIIRQFRLSSDIPLFVQLRHSLTEAKPPDKSISAEEIHEELNAPNQNPEKDRWVTTTSDAPDVLLGYGLGYHTLPERYLAWVEVHPAWRRKGLGSAILDRIISRALEVGAEHLLVNGKASDTVGQMFLCQNGFQVVSDSWFMSTPGDLLLAAPVWPSGYTVQSFAEVQNYQILKDAYFGSCRDLWGHGANSKQQERIIQPIAAEWGSWFTKSDPSGKGIFFAFTSDGHVAGICRGIDGIIADRTGNDEPGLVDALGVVPEHRLNQLYSPLTLTVMHWLRARGHKTLTLESYGTDETVMDIYRGLGFKLDQHYFAYCLELPAIPTM